MLTLILYVVQHRQELSTPHDDTAYLARAQAAYFIQTLQNDIENMYTPSGSGVSDETTCELRMSRNGRTRSFTFPTLRYLDGATPTIVHVTYELEGEAQQIQTRGGPRDLYRLQRFIDEGQNIRSLGGSSTQIVDFLVELFPVMPEGESDLRVLSGACPDALNQVRVAFRVALPDPGASASSDTLLSTTARYAATVRPRNDASSLLALRAD